LFVVVLAYVLAGCNVPTPSLCGDELGEVDESKRGLAQGDLTSAGVQWNE
jgi:hypothetical protein